MSLVRLSYSNKEKVGKTKRSLPRNITVSEDMPYEVRMARKQLQPEVNDLNANGQRAWLAWPAKLIVNGREVKKVRPRYSRYAPSAPRSNTRGDASVQGDLAAGGRGFRFGEGHALSTGGRRWETSQRGAAGGGSGPQTGATVSAADVLRRSVQAEVTASGGGDTPGAEPRKWASCGGGIQAANNIV